MKKFKKLNLFIKLGNPKPIHPVKLNLYPARTKREWKLIDTKPFADSDHDRVPNIIDCKPLNKKKQDFFYGREEDFPEWERRRKEIMKARIKSQGSLGFGKERNEEIRESVKTIKRSGVHKKLKEFVSSSSRGYDVPEDFRDTVAIQDEMLGEDKAQKLSDERLDKELKPLKEMLDEPNYLDEDYFKD